MINIIKKYKNLSFEDKTIFMCCFSICLNLLLAIGKMVVSIYTGIFFFVSGLVNIFIMLSKLFCYIGITKPDKLSFKKVNILISILLMSAGIMYGIYMTRLLYLDVSINKYNEILGITIAMISFIEMFFAIRGILKVYGKGHFLRNIKIINFGSACIAMVLASVAITSFSQIESEFNKFNGIMGLVVSFILILLSVFVIIAPKFSLVDNDYYEYNHS